MTKEEQLALVIIELEAVVNCEVSPIDTIDKDLCLDSLDICAIIWDIEKSIDKKIPDLDGEYSKIVSGTVEEFNEWIYLHAH